jgi:hypothetical protein
MPTPPLGVTVAVSSQSADPGDGRATAPLQPALLVLAVWGYASLFAVASLFITEILALVYAPREIPKAVQGAVVGSLCLAALAGCRPLVQAARPLWRDLR